MHVYFFSNIKKILLLQYILWEPLTFVLLFHDYFDSCSMTRFVKIIHHHVKLSAWASYKYNVVLDDLRIWLYRDWTYYLQFTRKPLFFYICKKWNQRYLYSYVYAKCLTYIYFFSVMYMYTNYIYMSLYNRGGLYYFISAIHKRNKKKLNFCRQRSKMPRSPRSFLWAMEFKSRNVYFFIVLLCTGHQRKKRVTLLNTL